MGSIEEQNNSIIKSFRHSEEALKNFVKCDIGCLYFKGHEDEHYNSLRHYRNGGTGMCKAKKDLINSMTEQPMCATDIFMTKTDILLTKKEIKKKAKRQNKRK